MRLWHTLIILNCERAWSWLWDLKPLFIAALLLLLIVIGHLKELQYFASLKIMYTKSMSNTGWERYNWTILWSIESSYFAAIMDGMPSFLGICNCRTVENVLSAHESEIVYYKKLPLNQLNRQGKLHEYNSIKLYILHC